MKKILNTISTVLVAIVVGLVLVMYGPKLVGYEPLMVLSGSMEPTYHVGSLVYVGKTDPTDLKEGDVITFSINDQTLVTHRIIEVNQEEQWVRTKGDANENEDGGTTSFTKIKGVVKFSIPFLGYLAAYLATKSGMIMAVTVVIVILLLSVLPDMLFKESEGEDSEK